MIASSIRLQRPALTLTLSQRERGLRGAFSRRERGLRWRAVFVAAVLAAGWPSASLAAEPKNPYQPAGAPADPKVPAQWNMYHDYAQVTKLLEAMAAAHPQRARLQSVGRSYQGRQMWVFTVTSFDKGDDRRKPAFFICGAIHANEIQGTEVSLYTAWYLLEMYGRSPFITKLVDQRAFYFVPMMSPDSRDAHMYRPNSTNSPRAGQIPVDRNRDGIVDDGGRDDLDGDGHITQMRVRDPNGRWKPHPEFPNLMIPCKPDEPGQYRLLGEEGFDKNNDGRMNQGGVGSYDPNRDWPWMWQPGYVQRGAYHYPFSVPENRAVADFVMDHPNIAGAQSYHNSGGMILRGPGAREDVMNSADVAVHDAIAKRGEEMLPSYKYLETATGLYEVYGGEGEWFYAMRGIFAFSNELFPRFNFFRKPPDGVDSREEIQTFDKYLLFSDGTVPWHEVNHPQYGKIEVGGLKKNWVRQPPSFLLEEECHRNMAFTLYHADQMPRVEIQSAAARKLPGGLVEVTAVVANHRVTPTHAAVDVQHKITSPDLVSIEAKGLKVVLGLTSDDQFFLNAAEQKRRPEQMRVATIRAMGAAYVRWLVRGEGPYTIHVMSQKGGSDQREVRL